jgi:hypothetical protein
MIVGQIMEGQDWFHVRDFPPNAQWVRLLLLPNTGEGHKGRREGTFSQI